MHARASTRESGDWPIVPSVLSIALSPGDCSRKHDSFVVVDSRDTVLKVCRDVLAPLVRADGGEIYLVSAAADDVHLHLTGACAGCPGASITRERMLEPAIARVLPKVKLRVTTGIHAPSGAEKV